MQLIGILEVVFLIPIAAISAITVGTRIMTLITRHERCQNCEMVYTLKDQPLTCASCQDVFCKQCLVYSVKGQKFGLFSSEVRSGDSKSLKQKLVRAASKRSFLSLTAFVVTCIRSLHAGLHGLFQPVV